MKRKKKEAEKICIYVLHTIRGWVFTDIRLETISKEKKRGMKESRKWGME